MDDREEKVHTGMAELILFITKWKQGNRAFNDPKDKQATHQDGHSFNGPLFKGIKICYEALPHTMNCKLRTIERFIEPTPQQGIRVYNQNNDSLCLQALQNW